MSEPARQMSETAILAEVQHLKDENICLREANVLITEAYDKNLNHVLAQLNKRTFELMEAKQELAARVNSCPSTCVEYKS